MSQSARGSRDKAIGILTGCACPDHDNLLPDVVLCRAMRSGVKDLSLKCLLQIHTTPAINIKHIRNDCSTHPVGDIGNVRRACTKTQRKDNVINMEDSFRSVGPPHSDVPLELPGLGRLSDRRSGNAQRSGRGPNIELHALGVGLEPTSLLLCGAPHRPSGRVSVARFSERE